MTTILVRNARFHAYHGVGDQEHQTGAYYLVSLEAELQECPALASDQLLDTVNYGSLLEVASREMLQPSLLVEHVVGRIGKALLEAFPTLEAVTVEVLKENPPTGFECPYAGVRHRFCR